MLEKRNVAAFVHPPCTESANFDGSLGNLVMEIHSALASGVATTTTGSCGTIEHIDLVEVFAELFGHLTNMMHVLIYQHVGLLLCELTTGPECHGLVLIGQLSRVHRGHSLPSHFSRLIFLPVVRHHGVFLTLVSSLSRVS